MVTFCTTQKVTTRTPLPGVSRFFKPRISPPKQQLPTNKIKTFPKGASRFFEPQISTPKIHFCTSPIKSFCRSAAFPPPLAALFFVADATNLCASRYYRRLRRFFSALRRCPCRDSTLRVLVGSRFEKPRTRLPQPWLHYTVCQRLSKKNRPAYAVKTKPLILRSSKSFVHLPWEFL